MHLHYKTHFIIKLKGQSDINSIASALRNQFPEDVMVITREDATSIITTSAPKITTGLAFTQINSILITAIALGGLIAVTVSNVAGRNKIFSLLRIRGAKKTDSVAIFIPEIVFVSLVAGSIGVALGLTLAVGFVSALTRFIPPLFTGGLLQMTVGWVTWLFLTIILITFALMYIITAFSQSKIRKGAS
jgi:predicted lysophospholipase L1 biosynthesis ABC-type transport system permease subunit